MSLFVVPQNIYEFWSVATRTVGHIGLGMTPTEADKAVGKLLVLFRLLRDERGIYDEWFALVTTYDIKGVNAHDARLAAAMRRHVIEHIY